MINWAILGAGSVARRRVIPALQANDRCSIGGLMVRDLDRARDLAGEFGVPHAYDNTTDLLADGQTDAVYISSPVNLHCEHVLAAAAAGKHVLCEKPMAMSASECERMIQACQQADVQLQVCFVLRGWPIYHQIKQIIDAGRLGQLVEIRAHLAKWNPRTPGEWRLDPAQSGGGAFTDVGSHYLDLFRYLAGDFACISYMQSSAVHGWPVEESGFAMVEFRSGAHGLLSVSCAVPCAGHVLEVFGTEGTLLLGKDLRLVSPDGETVWPVEYPDYYSGLVDNFCDGVDSGATPLASGVDGLRNSQAIHRAYESAREGRRLELPG